jgi:hypothetical protein
VVVWNHREVKEANREKKGKGCGRKEEGKRERDERGGGIFM